MEKLFYFLKNTIIIISQFVVFLTCILALGIGLKELINEDWRGVGFIMACGICVASWSYAKKEIWPK